MKVFSFACLTLRSGKDSGDECPTQCDMWDMASTRTLAPQAGTDSRSLGLGTRFGALDVVLDVLH